MALRIRKPGQQARDNRTQHTARRPINRPQNTLRVSVIDRLFSTSEKK